MLNHGVSAISAYAQIGAFLVARVLLEYEILNVFVAALRSVRGYGYLLRGVVRICNDKLGAVCAELDLGYAASVGSVFAVNAVFAGGSVLTVFSVFAVFTDNNAEVVARPVGIGDDKLAVVVDDCGSNTLRFGTSRKSEEQNYRTAKRQQQQEQFTKHGFAFSIHFIFSFCQ